MNLDEPVTSIANTARNSISDYCINVCKAKCCKRGKLVLFNDSEICAIVGKNKTKYLKNKILEKSKITKNYYYNLEKEPCKNLLQNDLCSIHKDKNKPKICDDYPIFLTKKCVIIAKDCEAAQNNLLEKYITEIESLGYKRI